MDPYQQQIEHLFITKNQKLILSLLECITKINNFRLTSISLTNYNVLNKILVNELHQNLWLKINSNYIIVFILNELGY